MKVRVLVRADGVSVVYPAPKSRRAGESEEAWLHRVFTKATPIGATFFDIDSSALPASREYRGAWTADAGKKTVSVDVAKRAQIDALRQVEQKRAIALETLIAKEMTP